MVKIREALVSALPVTVLVYILAMTPVLELSKVEMITFTVSAVLLVVGIGLFSMGADLAMTPMGSHLGAGLSRKKKLGLLLAVCFVLGMLITVAEPDLQVLSGQVSAVMNGTVLVYAVGVGFTFVGLVFFLTGVNVGFMSVGYKLGLSLAKQSPALLICLGLLIGVLVVLAEPAIHVLNAQVEEVTGGLVSKRSMMVGLCVGVGAAITLSMVRIVYDFSLVYYVIPGYFLSMALSLFVPPVYTAIAFDSGGVASGPMTSGFLLPMAVGACVGLQGAEAVLRDAFGVVAMVAMAPLITIQLLGFRGILAEKVNERRAMRRILDADDQQIINFM